MGSSFQHVNCRVGGTHSVYSRYGHGTYCWIIRGIFIDGKKAAQSSMSTSVIIWSLSLWMAWTSHSSSHIKQTPQILRMHLDEDAYIYPWNHHPMLTYRMLPASRQSLCALSQPKPLPQLTTMTTSKATHEFVIGLYLNGSIPYVFFASCSLHYYICVVLIFCQ